ncbi:hypothetical protein [Rhodopirellula halodulae]|uniref:hypothetical protein n=1 Tax=Rhodopirellula halodulae TaxID=2894198 RepID=UPI001E3F20DF|nr:hypothetical protein [Rhodopirellula sp. JC737]MCC9655787.1 hypothetical protein [Rhodopirellula sp. JC737]
MPWSDMDAAREGLSLAGSLFAVLSTFYFWLIRANRERAKVEACAVNGLRGTMLMAMEDTATYRSVQPSENEIVLKYWLDLAIVNNSELPNALLGIKVWMKFADGRWHAMQVGAVESGEDLFPINVDPLTTAALHLTLATKIPGEVSGGFRERECAAGDALPSEVPIRIEMQALRDKVFVTELVDDGRRLLRTDAESMAASKTAA